MSTLLPTLLIALSAASVGLLGAAHLAYLYFSDKLTPRDAGLTTQLKAVSPVITRRTTMWKAWIGFNASHSLGALLFAAIYGYLAIAAPALLFNSAFLGLCGLATLVSYLVLAHRYWFNRPRQGISLALALYIGGFTMALIQNAA
jgi:hypothetical protein